MGLKNVGETSLVPEGGAYLPGDLDRIVQDLKLGKRGV